MLEGFEGNTTPDQIFGHDLASLVQSELQNTREEENDGLLEAMSPQALHDSMANQVAHSLGLNKGFLDTEEGQTMVYDIAEFLEKERGVDRLEGVSSALVTLLNQLIVPRQNQHPEGLARRIYEHLRGRKSRKIMDEEQAKRERFWMSKSE